MTKWEYLEIRIAFDGSKARPRYLNNEDVRDWKNAIPMPQFLNQLGAEGWELVSVGFASYCPDYYVLKRPKS